MKSTPTPADFQSRLRKIFTDESFDTISGRCEILAPMPDHEEYDAARIRLLRSSTKLPPYLMCCKVEPLLNSKQETFLFRQLNFYKHICNQYMHAFEQGDPNARFQAITTLGKIDRLRQHLTLANCQLAAKEIQRYPISLREELMSEGYNIIMRAVDYFDWRIGWKFSTYCVGALRNNLSRIIGNLTTLEKRFKASQQAAETAQDRDADAVYQEHQLAIAKANLSKFINRLSDRERLILQMHYGIDQPKQLLREIAQVIGVSKENVRRKELQAKEKLKKLLLESEYGEILTII